MNEEAVMSIIVLVAFFGGMVVGGGIAIAGMLAMMWLFLREG